MGGTDDPSNLVEVSVEEHAELHFDLYLKHGNWEDWIACQGLAGIMGHEEVVYHVSEERKRKTSQSNKEYYKTQKGQERRTLLSKKNRNVKSAELKQAWLDGKFDNRTKPSGRPKGVKEKRPRNRQFRKVWYNGTVYSNALEAASALGLHPVTVRGKASKQLDNFKYVKDCSAD